MKRASSRPASGSRAEIAGSAAGRYAFDGLDRTFHEKARLGLLAALLAHPDGLLFVRLRELCSLTDGNLNQHLKVLRDDGLVEIWKGGAGGRTQTLCRLVPAGRERFLAYLARLQQVVADVARSAAVSGPSPAD